MGLITPSLCEAADSAAGKREEACADPGHASCHRMPINTHAYEDAGFDHTEGCLEVEWYQEQKPLTVRGPAGVCVSRRRC